MKKYIFPSILAIAGIAFVGYGIMTNKGGTNRQPANVHYFNNGDTLFPDMVCSDTLIVTNADGLNKGMAYIEQGIIDGTDGDIDSIMHSNCIDINR